MVKKTRNLKIKPSASKKFIEFINHGCYPGFTMFSCGFKYDEIISELKKMYKTTKEEEKDQHWLIALQGDKVLIDGGTKFGLRRVIENTKTGETKDLFYIILDEFKFEDYDYLALAHECLHICQFFLPNILDRNKEIEAEAYFHSHLMKKCLEAIRK